MRLMAVATACALVGCSNTPSTPATAADASSADAAAPDAPDDASAPCLTCVDAQPIWTVTSAPLGVRMADMLHDCTGVEACHSANFGGLSISAGDEFSDLINVRSTERPDLVRVTAGDPARSYLFLKLAGDGGIEGGRMPLDRKFDPRMPELAWQWIEAGAPTH